MSALVAGVPSPLRSTSSPISSLPARSIADRRSFLLTARTNYYGLIENEVEYITWAELVKNVEQNRL